MGLKRKLAAVMRHRREDPSTAPSRAPEAGRGKEEERTEEEMLVEAPTQPEEAPQGEEMEVEDTTAVEGDGDEEDNPTVQGGDRRPRVSL